MRSYEPTDAKERALWVIFERKLGEPVDSVELLERIGNKTRYLVTGMETLESQEIAVTDYEISRVMAA